MRRQGYDGGEAALVYSRWAGEPESLPASWVDHLTPCSMSGPVSEQGDIVDKNYTAAVDKMLTTPPLTKNVPTPLTIN